MSEIDDLKNANRVLQEKVIRQRKELRRLYTDNRVLAEMYSKYMEKYFQLLEQSNDAS